MYIFDWFFFALFVCLKYTEFSLLNQVFILVSRFFLNFRLTRIFHTNYVNFWFIVVFFTAAFESRLSAGFLLYLRLISQSGWSVWQSAVHSWIFIIHRDLLIVHLSHNLSFSLSLKYLKPLSPSLSPFFALFISLSLCLVHSLPTLRVVRSIDWFNRVFFTLACVAVIVLNALLIFCFWQISNQSAFFARHFFFFLCFLPLPQPIQCNSSCTHNGYLLIIIKMFINSME